jgi:hypothetical protein
MAKIDSVKDGSYPQNMVDPFGRRISLTASLGWRRQWMRWDEGHACCRAHVSGPPGQTTTCERGHPPDAAALL